MARLGDVRARPGRQRFLRLSRVAALAICAVAGAVSLSLLASETPESAIPAPANPRTDPQTPARVRRHAAGEGATAVETIRVTCPADVPDACTEDAAPVDPSVCVVEGRVVEEGGGAAAGVQIWLLDAFGKAGGTVSAGDGRFRLSCRETGPARCVAVRDDRVPSIGPWIVRARGTRSAAGTLELAEGASISGIVQDASDDPVSGAWVKLTPLDPAVREAWEGVTKRVGTVMWTCNAGGGFTAWPIPAGAYRVEVSPPGRCPWWGGDVIVRTGPHVVTLRLPPDLCPRAFEVRVEARDEDGAPVRHFTATLEAWEQSQYAYTYEGEASLSLVSVPPARLTVQANGFEPAVVEHAESRGEVVVVDLVRLREEEPRLEILGVVEIEGFAPGRCGRVRVAAFSATASEEPPAPAATCDVAPSGDFRLPELGPGRYRLEACGEVEIGGEWVGVAGSAVASGGDDRVSIEAGRLATIDADVHLPGGEACDELCVTLTDERPGGRAETRSFLEPLLHAELGGVARDGVFEASFSARRSDEWMRGVVFGHVTPGSSSLQVRFEPGSSIEGVVERPDGSPVVAAQVWTSEKRPHYRAAATGLDGRFRLTGLRDGVERLRVEAPGLVCEEEETPAKAGGDLVRLVLTPRR